MAVVLKATAPIYFKKESVIMTWMVKRVPLDFDYPVRKIWYGYLIQPGFCKSADKVDFCTECKNFARLKKIPLDESGCPAYDSYLKKQMQFFEPPEGPGYQLWEDITEGSPVSPIFESMDGLVKWCAENEPIFANVKVTAEEWRQYLESGQTGFVLRRILD